MTNLKPLTEIPNHVEEGDLIRIVINENQLLSGHVIALDSPYCKTPPKHRELFVTLSPSYPQRSNDKEFYFTSRDECLGYEIVRRSNSGIPPCDSGIRTFHQPSQTTQENTEPACMDTDDVFEVNPKYL